MGWTDGRIDGRTDGWEDRWKNTCIGDWMDSMLQALTERPEAMKTGQQHKGCYDGEDDLLVPLHHLPGTATQSSSPRPNNGNAAVVED